MAKPEIKDFCIGFSKMRKMARRDTAKFLLAYLKIVLNEKNWAEVSRVKEELHRMCLEDSMGIVVRSRFQQNAEEERGSIFHAARESKNDKNNINKLKVDNSIVENKEQIEDIVTSYFNSLFNGYHNYNLEDTGRSFTPDYRNLDKFLTGIGKLNNQESQGLHADLIMEDLDDVLKTCKNNKAPGLDGLPY